MKKSFKRGIAIAAASAMALSVIGVGNIVRSNAADITRDGAGLVRDIQLSASSDGELQITRKDIGNKQMGKENSWTIFVYMCGSDLESYYGLANMDINEMIAANESDNVNVIVQTGGARTWRGNGISATETGRYEVRNNKLQLIEKLPAANMGKEETLEDFLNWGIDNYAAEHMGLVYWNHGGGSVTGVCFDERNSYDSLSLSELEKAMSSASKKMTDKFDFVGFDACLMANIEMANVLSPYAAYMIASEETEPGYGWDYEPFINKLVENPDVDPEEVGKEVVDSYYASLVEINQQSGGTLSLFDLSKLDNVMKQFNRVAKNMHESADSTTTITQYTRVASRSDNYGGNNSYEGYTNMVDMGDFAKNMSKYVSGTNELLDAIDDMVIYMKNGSTYTDSKGVSFYYPLSVDGMGEMNILRNVIVSPYYMDYLDKVLYASKYSSLSGFTSNEWENSDYYFDKDFEFLNYMFRSFSDYKSKYMDKSYFANAKFDDNWYNWYTKKAQQSSDQISPKLADDFDLLNNKVIRSNVSENVLENLVTADYQVVVSNGDSVNVLGTVGTADRDVKFDGKWFTLSDGQYLAAEFITENNSLSLYAAPVMMDGKKVSIRFVADKNKNVFILGAWDGIAKSGQAGKGLREIKSGSKITPLYTSLNPTTGEIETVEGTETSVYGDIITNKTVDNSAFVLRTVDAFGNTTYSTPIAK